MREIDAVDPGPKARAASAAEPAYDGTLVGGRTSVLDWEEFYREFRQPGFIPGYELQNRLGGGAFGEVYKAKKTSIGKAYAIKFLKIDDEGQREVVQRELEQVRHFAAIDHPNLVTIEDMGIARGVPFLVMGYAGEDTLARRLRRAPLELSAALSFFVQTCRGVLALHDRRLVHFDLKPSNIFLRGDVARVGDYGLAKLLTDGNQTLSFGRGTPHYMAPEMLKGRADHRADLYSLGVVLYESLTGRTPFAAEGSSVVRVADEPTAFPEDFPSELRAVTSRCLETDPEKRFSSVEELLSELGQTGRQGDSISLPASAAAAGSGVAKDARLEPQGAAEVARRVWEDLRATRPGLSNHADPGTEVAHVPRAVEEVRATARVAARKLVAAPVAASGDTPVAAPVSVGAEGEPALAAGPVGPGQPEEPSNVLAFVRACGPAGRWFLREGAGLAEGLGRLLLLLVFMIAFGALLALFGVALIEGRWPWE